MDGSFWAKVHGAAAHFPIALVLCSWALDSASLLLPDQAVRRALNAAGFWTIIAGALGTVPAVASGLVMTKGVMLGHDAQRMHHLFAWPAFALIVATAVWRASGPGFSSRRSLGAYLAVAGIAAALVSAAGYWGGEMALGR